MHHWRHGAASLAAICCLASSALAWQTGTRGAAGSPVTRACALLTKELLLAHTPASPESMKLMMSMPADEEPIGKTGSACHYGNVTLQIDPFPATSVDRLVQKDWVKVAGIGDAAYFRDNRGEYAEIIARSGSRVVTIPMSVPRGRTATSIQSNVIGLTNGVLAKLK